MRKSVKCVSVLALCGVGFAAGRLSLTHPAATLSRGANAATVLSAMLVQPPPEMEMEMDEATLKMRAAGAPGENHRVLDSLIGEWRGFVRIRMEPGAEPMEMPTTISREWVLGGRYVTESVKSETDMGPFEGMGVIGYNNVDGLYEVGWIDNMSTAVFTEQGSYEAKTKTFRFSGKHRDPVTGHTILTSSVLDLSNPDRHVMRSTIPGPDGTPYEHFYGVFERVK